MSANKALTDKLTQLGEVLTAPSDARVAAADAKQLAVARRDEPPEWLVGLNEPDFKKMTPVQLAILVRQREFPPEQFGGVGRHLSWGNSFLVGTWLFMHGFHPSTHEWWYNWETNTPEMSVEGKLSKARREGWKLGAPRYKRHPEDETKQLTAWECWQPVFIEGGWQDFWYKADVRLFAFKKDGKTYKSGHWSTEAGREHMLRVRALDGCLKQVGYGFSEPLEIPDDVRVATPAAPQIEVVSAKVEPE